jgi:hypothetical protein
VRKEGREVEEGIGVKVWMVHSKCKSEDGKQLPSMTIRFPLITLGM